MIKPAHGYLLCSQERKENLIAFFGRQGEVVKRIVYYEIYMLLISDQEIDLDEKKVLEELSAGFDISDEEAEKIREQALLQKKADEDLKKLLGI